MHCRALLVLPLAASSALATPLLSRDVPLEPAGRAASVPVHCVDDAVEAGITQGNLYCVASDGTDLTCDQCIGNAEGWEGGATTAGGSACYITNGEDASLGNPTACPGDPPPGTDPDGNPVDPATATVDAFCSVAGSGGAFGFITFAGCYGWAYAQSSGSDIESMEAGLKILCNGFTYGLCTCIDSGVCGDDLGGGGSG